MDRKVRDGFLDRENDEGEARDLKFLLDEGLGLLASYASISDAGVRKALAGLMDAMANAERTAAIGKP